MSLQNGSSSPPVYYHPSLHCPGCCRSSGILTAVFDHGAPDRAQNASFPFLSTVQEMSPFLNSWVLQQRQRKQWLFSITRIPSSDSIWSLKEKSIFKNTEDRGTGYRRNLTPGSRLIHASFTHLLLRIRMLEGCLNHADGCYLKGSLTPYLHCLT